MDILNYKPNVTLIVLTFDLSTHWLQNVRNHGVAKRISWRHIQDFIF